MKKLITLTILIVICAGFSIRVNAQRNCGSWDYLQQQLTNDPTLELRMANYEQSLQKWIENNQTYINNVKTTITIPVVVHVVYNTTAQNISDTRVQEQIAVLNRDFAGLNTHSMQAFSTSLKVNTGIQFCLAQRTPSGAATTGIERRATTVTSFSSNDYVKSYSRGGLNAWDPTKYLNIWVCNLGGGLCGYSQFPTSGINGTFGSVINYLYFGVTGAVSPYNLGGTTTHELGHCFNLYHIWGDDGGSCLGSDFCTDVPNQANYTYGVHTGVLTDGCTNTSPGIMYMNFMDYSDDISYANFTPNQNARIAALFVPGGLLYSLSVSDGCTPPSTGSCGTPTGLAASSITTTSATLSWAAVSSAISYNVQYRQSGTTNFNTSSTSGTSMPLSGLTPSTSYEFQVQAVCSVAGTYSGLTNFTTLSASGCTDKYESNNIPKNAKAITVNTNINALIGTSSDVDYFKFSNTNTLKNIKITLTNLPADYNVSLYKSNGTTLVATSQNTGTTSESIVYNNAKAGTYVIKVYGYNGAYSATNCYTLNASISNSTFKEIQDISETEVTDGIQLFPNPANYELNVTFNSDNNETAVINIYDLTGRMVFTKNFQSAQGRNTYTLNTSDLSRGVYILTLENGGKMLNQKLVIEK